MLINDAMAKEIMSRQGRQLKDKRLMLAEGDKAACRIISGRWKMVRMLF